jgi:hypothetical protein
MGKHFILMLLLSQAKPKPPLIVTFQEEKEAVEDLSRTALEGITPMTQANHWGEITAALAASCPTPG